MASAASSAASDASDASDTLVTRRPAQQFLIPEHGIVLWAANTRPPRTNNDNGHPWYNINGKVKDVCCSDHPVPRFTQPSAAR